MVPAPVFVAVAGYVGREGEGAGGGVGCAVRVGVGVFVVGGVGSVLGVGSQARAVEINEKGLQ